MASARDDDQESSDDQESCEPEETAVTMFDAPFPQSDVTFVVEGSPVYASRAVLSMWSPVLAAMLNGDFAEASMKEIEVKDKKNCVFKDLMALLHPPTCRSTHVDVSNVRNILPLVHEYQIASLETECEDVLLKLKPTSELLHLADIYRQNRLLEACINDLAVKSDCKQIKSGAQFATLSAEVRSKLYFRKLEILDEINTVMTDEPCPHKRLPVLRKYNQTAAISGCEAELLLLPERGSERWVSSNPDSVHLYLIAHHYGLSRLMATSEAKVVRQLVSDIVEHDAYKRMSVQVKLRLMASKAEYAERILASIVWTMTGEYHSRFHKRKKTSLAALDQHCINYFKTLYPQHYKSFVVDKYPYHHERVYECFDCV